MVGLVTASHFPCFNYVTWDRDEGLGRGREILKACLLSVPTFTAVELKKKKSPQAKILCIANKIVSPGFYQHRSHKELTAVYVNEQDLLFSDLFFHSKKHYFMLSFKHGNKEQ